MLFGAVSAFSPQHGEQTRIDWTVTYNRDAQSSGLTRLLREGHPDYEFPELATERSSANLSWEVAANDSVLSDGRSIFSYSNVADSFAAVRIGVSIGAEGLGVLTPVPEPETYALMLFGVGLVGWHVRRSRSLAGAASILTSQRG